MRSMIRILIALVVLVISSPAMSQMFNLKIINIRNIKGVLKIGIYRDADSYNKDQPFLIKKCNKNCVTNGTLNINITLDKGNYGVAVLDDENDDGRMEYNVLGIPREGYGFSGFEHKGLTRPDFSDFNFLVTDSTREIVVKVRYMII
jgi:uncharacterized protein (DUF2141 family)